MARPIDITIKNYRRFPESLPARFRLGGFTALVGINNSGKSSLLRFFYEFRDLFERLDSGGQFNAIFGGGLGFSYRGLSDTREVFSLSTDGPIQVEISLPDAANQAELTKLT